MVWIKSELYLTSHYQCILASNLICWSSLHSALNLTSQMTVSPAVFCYLIAHLFSRSLISVINALDLTRNSQPLCYWSASYIKYFFDENMWFNVNFLILSQFLTLMISLHPMLCIHIFFNRFLSRTLPSFYWVYVASIWYQRSHRGSFCEKMPEAALTSDRTSSNWLQDSSAAGHSWDCHQFWQCLWDN